MKGFWSKFWKIFLIILIVYFGLSLIYFWIAWLTGFDALMPLFGWVYVTVIWILSGGQGLGI